MPPSRCTSVEKQLAGFSRLPAGGGQTESTGGQHGVGCRSPLWRVKPTIRRLPTRPHPPGILFGKKTRSPTVARYPSALSLDDAVPGSDQIAQGLPSNGRVAIEEPLDHLIGSRSRSHSGGIHSKHKNTQRGHPFVGSLEKNGGDDGT